jgi:ubiquinone/menaquinone biosynthesis C-methylase UbiE
MEYTQGLRDFWTVATLEQAKHERITVPPRPEAWTDEYQARLLDEALGDLPLAPGALILDYGCGVGRMARQVARRGCRVLAVDVAGQMLAFCRDYCTGLANIEYLITDGYGVPSVPDGSLDGAYSFYVFQHMPCHQMARSVLADFYRVLKPGAWCRVQTVDTRTQDPVAQVGFHGERQTPALMLEMAKQVGFRRIQLWLGVENAHDHLTLTAIK